MRRRQNWDFCESVSSFLSRSLFYFVFLVYQQFCFPLYRLSFAWNCGCLTFLGKGQISVNLQRVVGKQRNWQWIFPQNVIFFCKCNPVRIVQNIQNEVLLERSIFANVVAYQFMNLNWKLNWSRKINVHRSIRNENDQSNRRRVKASTNFFCQFFNCHKAVCLRKHMLLVSECECPI